MSRVPYSSPHWQDDTPYGFQQMFPYDGPDDEPEVCDDPDCDCQDAA